MRLAALIFAATFAVISPTKRGFSVSRSDGILFGHNDLVFAVTSIDVQIMFLTCSNALDYIGRPLDLRRYYGFQNSKCFSEDL